MDELFTNGMRKKRENTRCTAIYICESTSDTWQSVVVSIHQPLATNFTFQ